MAFRNSFKRRVKLAKRAGIPGNEQYLNRLILRTLSKKNRKKL